MKYGMFFVGTDFYDHNRDVHPSTAFLFDSDSARGNWHINLEDAKMLWAKKRYAWVWWMVVDDHGGAAPPTVQIQEVRHPLKTRVQLNAKAAPTGKAAPKKSASKPTMDAAFIQAVYQQAPVQLDMGQIVPDNQY